MQIFLKSEVKRITAITAAVFCTMMIFLATPVEVFSEDVAGIEDGQKGTGQETAVKEETLKISSEDAAKIENMEEESSKIKSNLDEINQDLLDLGSEIADVEELIETTDGKIEMTKEQLAIARHLEEQQYEDMKLRIKYMYENGEESLLQLICTAEGMTDFLNRIDFIQNISEYDRTKLEDLRTLQQTIAEQDEVLASEQKAQKELEEKLASQREELNKKAEETSTDLELLASRIEKMKEDAAKKAAEKAERAAREAEEARRAAKEAEEKRKAEEEAARQAAQAASASATTYNMPSGKGVLTKYKGVNYFNGHKETYYSQRVLPGGGLKIPGRHVAEDGTIRDENNYICVASSDYPKGTVVETSLGPGKVYDTGCARGTIDIYTDW